jgi:hypothetical protein
MHEYATDQSAHMNHCTLSPDEMKLLDGDDPHNSLLESPFLTQLFAASVQELVVEHNVLFRERISERTFAQRLSLIIERRMRERGLRHHYADVEYNRLDGELKYVPGDSCICDNLLGRPVGHDNVTADLIIHGRHMVPRPYDNLLAIEVKPDDADSDRVAYDRCRLLRMSLHNDLRTAQNYRYAIFLVLRATRPNGRWSYLEHWPYYPGAALELQNRENVGYYETWVQGEPSDFTVFLRPA